MFPSFVATPGGRDAQFYFYNTTKSGSTGDANQVGNGTGDNETLQYSQLSVVTNPSGLTGSFVTFVLDINQEKSEPFLSLDRIALFKSSNGGLYDWNGSSLTEPSGGAAPFWLATDSVRLDYTLAKGSGNTIDMFLYIPTSVFSGAGVTGSSYLQLFSEFGLAASPTGDKKAKWANNDGFEEWAYYRCPPGTTCAPPDQYVPLPGSVALLGVGLLALAVARRREVD